MAEAWLTSGEMRKVELRAGFHTVCLNRALFTMVHLSYRHNTRATPVPSSSRIADPRAVQAMIPPISMTPTATITPTRANSCISGPLFGQKAGHALFANRPMHGGGEQAKPG